MTSTNSFIRHLGSVPVNLEDFELHATELRNAKKPKATAKATQKTSIWANVDRQVRAKLLHEAYELIAGFTPSDLNRPHMFFGVVLDSKYRSDWSVDVREQFAYEVLLNKFDVMLKRNLEHKDQGLVIHDRRVIAERDIQGWTAEWRAAAGRVGQLKNLADVPLFADSSSFAPAAGCRPGRVLALSALRARATRRCVLQRAVEFVRRGQQGTARLHSLHAVVRQWLLPLRAVLRSNGARSRTYREAKGQTQVRTKASVSPSSRRSAEGLRLAAPSHWPLGVSSHGVAHTTRRPIIPRIPRSNLAAAERAAHVLRVWHVCEVLQGVVLDERTALALC